MSLYGGIKFSIGDTKGSLDERPGKSETKPLQVLGGGALENPAQKSNNDDTDDIPSGARTSSKGSGQVAKPEKTSAALRFAPRIRQQKPTAGPSTTYTAEPVFIDTLQPGPSSASSSSTQAKTHETVFGTDGKALARAPAMTLNAGKRERGQEDWERRKQKKKQRRRQQQQQLISDFKPDEQYDPNRPNDLGEYQYYRKKLREEKRARLAEEKKRREQDGSGESSYYSVSEDEAPRRDAPKMWAPPSSIYGTQPKSVPPPPPPPMTRPISPPAPPADGNDAYARRVAMSQAPTGDDAYARRQAMSQAPTGDEAYARRQAMSSRPPPAEAHRPLPPPPSSNSSWNQASGDEAYARRAALSQIPVHQARPPTIMPNFTPAAMNMPPFPPSQGYAPPNMPPFAPSQQPASLPPLPPKQSSSGPPTSSAPVELSSIPGFGARPTPTANPTVPLSEPETEPPTPAPPNKEDFARMLEERKKAAASIAERLKNLGPPLPAHPPIPEPEDGSGTFAEKMFRKWGHVEGTGLGADGSGIKYALTAEHVAKPVDPKQPLSKRQLAKQKAAAANAKTKNRKWVMHATNRGKIVNANEEEKRIEEQGKYGEASRIICLVGLVGGEDDIDEDLSEEIGDECSKYGIVERVVQHLVEPPPVDPAECLRVFVVFSGMAGAWRTVKELDGRFFGGRKLRATYFDENRFNAGERDGSLL